jgi:hypothetical protein
LTFEKAGEETVDGVRTIKLRFVEHGSPTVVRHGDTGKDAPAEGMFWVDPATGRIVRTLMRLNLGDSRMEVTVGYKPADATGGTWVPAEMREVFAGAEEMLECLARYSKVRRFQVSTETVIK